MRIATPGALSTRAREARLSICASLVVVMLAAACATNPVTGRREFTLMSESQEIQIGRELDVQVRQEMGEYADRELQEYVAGIGMKLARISHRPNLPWSFTIVDVPAVNAFALPGGYIYMTRGILAYLDNEAELAGVLGHEIGHVTARHAVQAYTRATGAQLGLLVGSIFVPQTRPFGQLAETGLGVLFLKYGRDDELEADRLGAQYEAQLGWAPRAVPDFLTTLARLDEAADRRGVPNWLSTHPMPADRVELIETTVAEIESDRTGEWVTADEEYLRRIDGLVFGDNPEEGIVRGNVFLHPVLRFGLEFPAGWEITNGRTQVVAQEPGNKVFIIVQLVEQPRGGDIEEIARDNMQRAGFRLQQGGRTSLNGLDAYVGTYDGRVQDLGEVHTRAAHILHQGRVYVVAGLTPRELFAGAEAAFSSSIRSFRPLARDEAENVRPNRVAVYTARPGDTWQSIAERIGGGIVRASTLAIMNGHAVNDQPTPGERLKVVVAG